MWEKIKMNKVVNLDEKRTETPSPEPSKDDRTSIETVGKVLGRIKHADRTVGNANPELYVNKGPGPH